MHYRYHQTKSILYRPDVELSDEAKKMKLRIIDVFHSEKISIEGKGGESTNGGDFEEL